MQRKQVKNYIASPLNYIGGKARILDQLLPIFPNEIDIFVDLFCGGCNVGMNVNADLVIYNDTSSPLIGLLKTFRRLRPDTIVRKINEIINEFEFSQTRFHNFAYYGGGANLGVSVYNRQKFLKLRDRFNNHQKKDIEYYILLYTLILFGFNNQIRFNDRGEFNLPVGKRDFNTTIEAKLIKFVEKLHSQNCQFYNVDFRRFNFDKLTNNSLVYCDPPYIITNATYNENGGWDTRDELELLELLDSLNDRGIRFALSNVLEHEGKTNDFLINWVRQNNYLVSEIFMDYHYSNYQKKSKKPESREVVITNF